MSKIHETAIVSPKAEIADEVEIGPFTIIEDEVKIGAGCVIGPFVQIASGAVLGKNVKVFKGVVISTQPQDLKFGGEKTGVSIGDNTMIREYVTINRGTSAHGTTEVGSDCLLMAYAHVAHDCIIGNNVIMANSVNLAGHIEVDDYAIIGGVVPIHQFVKIGAHCMIGGGFRVQQDVCPYSMVAGYPLKIVGLNLIGLKRRGFSREVLSQLAKVYKILFFSSLNTTQAVERITGEFEILPETQVILDFIERSDRGLIK